VTVDLRLLAIADPDVLGGHDLVMAARAAEAGGATAVQLRMKRAGAGAMLAAARRLRAELTVPLYLNDRADVAWTAGAHGVHVGADDLPAEALRLVAPPGFRIGVSVGTPAEAEAACRADPDYWSIGSVFATASKTDAGTPIGLPGFRALAALAPSGMPVIGIGGMTAENAGELIRAGGQGVAVISAIFAAGDIERAARQLRDAVDAAMKPDELRKG
jgi:thiamine-phosphate diphosphorylase